ncbi:peptidoglycan-binding protein [Tabrizicola flagellatus]|uniref:peptidoglycan-binding protein n=1 Tax=Tabrizicola flagellatus TaxID=2593021 RepID=UPI0011F32F41|nr:peptidoglycan-binding protein [Tabrizicola flagellatus]
MLLSFNAAKTTLLAGLTALSIAAVPATPALAWGDREQGFVAGVATAVIVDEIIKSRRARMAAPVYVAPAPNFVEPRHSYVEPRRTVGTSIYSTPAARAFQSYSLSERKAIQRNLRAWGYYRGGIDGAFGPGTYNAIVAYARDEGASASLRSTSGAYGLYDGMIY